MFTIVKFVKYRNNKKGIIGVRVYRNNRKIIGIIGKREKITLILPRDSDWFGGYSLLSYAALLILHITVLYPSFFPCEL